jgi:thiosulfate/3-mercaptopyruvate sulfurtransferase
MRRTVAVSLFAMMLGILATTCVAAASTSYVHPEALASTEWLYANLDDPTVCVIAAADCRQLTHKDSYTAGHIAGAIYLNVFAELSDPESAVPLMILQPEGFEDLMGRLGINSGTTVVVYDEGGGLWAAKVWWALRYYGHEDVRILNGGLAKWTAEDRPLETVEITPTPTTFKACVVPELRATIVDVKLAIGNPDVRIIDALAETAYAAGHIPSARNLPAPSSIDLATQTILPLDDLTQLWLAADLEPDQLAITYCGAGYFGAFDLFVLYLMGHEKAALYDGSWMEWKANPELPVETSSTDT